MRPIATDVVRSVVCVYVCVGHFRVSPAKMAELVDIQFVGADFSVQGIV